MGSFISTWFCLESWTFQLDAKQNYRCETSPRNMVQTEHTNLNPTERGGLDQLEHGLVCFQCENLFFWRFRLSYQTIGTKGKNQQNATKWAAMSNLSHNRLKPTHIPCQWLNTPTLGEVYFTMIGGADIGSESDVAMNAWLPTASYLCVNISDTSNIKIK